MDILTPRLEFVSIPDAMVGKSTLPDRELRTYPMRKGPFDDSNNSLNGKVLGSYQKMNVIRHDDKRMQLVVALATVVLQHL